MGRLVEFKDQPGVVETALALSGSSAQSKIQAYPGDADYFERVNIIAATKEEACRILAGLMRDKALATAKGPTYQFIEVKFGSYPFDLVVEGRTYKAGSPIAWTPGANRGRADRGLPAGRARRVPCAGRKLRWQPGWCKLDWVVADPVRGRLANASNMLDVTWEAPMAPSRRWTAISTPTSRRSTWRPSRSRSSPSWPSTSRPMRWTNMSTALEREVKKYLTKDINYGKAAKRMYNIFRLTGRYSEAMFVRELFDEPASLLYQVWSLIRTLDDTARRGIASP